MLNNDSPSLIKTARGINVKSLSAKDFEKKYASRKRVGKTARDKAKKKVDHEAV